MVRASKNSVSIVEVLQQVPVVYKYFIPLARLMYKSLALRPSTGLSNMVPIAYGTVESNANVLSGTGNFTATLSAGVIIITVNNQNMSVNNSTCSIVPYSSTFRSSSILYSKNKLNVYIFNSAGNLSATTFQFVIYKL